MNIYLAPLNSLLKSTIALLINWTFASLHGYIDDSACADYATDTSHKPSANFDQCVAMPTRYIMKKVKMCSNKPN